MKITRLMLVDDHDIVRTGLRTYLETISGFEVVAEAGNGSEAIQKAVETQPDVIIMDITMPEMDGLTATRRLKTVCPDSHILALTVHQDKQYFFAMLAAGASGYVTKHAAVEDLVAAIRSVAGGNVYLQPTLARCLLDDYRRLLAGVKLEPRTEMESKTGRHKDLEVLSLRELQVLEGIAQGLSNHQIGEQLGISHKTVARHRERIMYKLSLHSATELVKFAIRTGLIDVS